MFLIGKLNFPRERNPVFRAVLLGEHDLADTEESDHKVVGFKR